MSDWERSETAGRAAAAGAGGCGASLIDKTLVVLACLVLAIAPLSAIRRILRIERMPPWVVAGSAALGLALAALALRRLRHERRTAGDNPYAIDVAANEVEDHTVSGAAAAPVDGAADAWALDIGGGRLLVLRGPFLAEMSDPSHNPFPNSDFRVTVLPHSRAVLNLECIGDALPPRPAVHLDALPENLSVVRGSIDGRAEP